VWLFWAFVRLVGTAYFKKHLVAFLQDKPESLYMSLPCDASIHERHKAWYNKIRETVWEQVIDEESAPPSFDALHLHWKRCMWVVMYWNKANKNTIDMPCESNHHHTLMFYIFYI
jgi:hypothetical protein